MNDAPSVEARTRRTSRETLSSRVHDARRRMPMISVQNTDFRHAGYWLNWRHPERAFVIDDHQRWMRRPGNPERLGVRGNVVARFADYPYIADDENERARFLRFVMETAPVMRIRGHGDFITFEYWAATPAAVAKARRAIARFCQTVGVGKLMNRVVVNFKDEHVPT